MPPLYEQRRILIGDCTRLILRWLDLLDADGRRNVIESMVRRFSLPQLRTMRTHVAEQVATLATNQPERDDAGEITALRAEIKRLQTEREFDAVLAPLDAAEISALRVAVERLRAAVAAVEWIDRQDADGWCPWCDYRKPFGHAPDCQRQIALGL